MEIDNNGAERSLRGVARLSSELDAHGDQQYSVVDNRLLETLKGVPNRPLDGVEHPLTIFGTDKIPNPAISLLRPGASFLMFNDLNWIAQDPCEIVAATPSALKTIRVTLASPVLQVTESDPPLW